MFLVPVRGPLARVPLVGGSEFDRENFFLQNLGKEESKRNKKEEKLVK